VRGPAPDEATTADALLTGACPGSEYFAVLSTDGTKLYATYTDATFDFASSDGTGGTPPARVACFDAAAGGSPMTVAAPGELIRVVGSGFGPLTPLAITPGADGTYPRTAGGFGVTIGGMDAPILGVARGSITVQVPYEAASAAAGGTLALNVTEDGQALNSIPIAIAAGPQLTLFDTGSRDNPLKLPALAAINEDGTANAPDNPAAAGSLVMLFGSGMGALSAPLATGALNPVAATGSPAIGTAAYQECIGCTAILFLGAAPGLSTGIVQITVRMPVAGVGGARPVGVGIVASQTFPGLSAFQPTGVVFAQ
jgi:uncharacterized protein (TIGR03437 family)